MNNDIILDRETYRKLKSLSRENLSDVLNSFYLKEKKAALSSIKRVHIDLDKIRSEISAVDGIGVVRLNHIMEIIEQNLQEK